MDRFIRRADPRTLSVRDLLGSEPGPLAFSSHDPMGGWVSDRANSLVPAASIFFHRREAMTAFATLISLEGEVANVTGTRVNASLSSATLAWKVGDGARRLRMRRSEDGVAVERLA